nr:hypothetical protein OG999_08555 [Streptomyces sp. NBC_00886]
MRTRACSESGVVPRGHRPSVLAPYPEPLANRTPLEGSSGAWLICADVSG